MRMQNEEDAKRGSLEEMLAQQDAYDKQIAKVRIYPEFISCMRSKRAGIHALGTLLGPTLLAYSSGGVRCLRPSSLLR